MSAGKHAKFRVNWNPEVHEYVLLALIKALKDEKKAIPWKAVANQLHPDLQEATLKRHVEIKMKKDMLDKGDVYPPGPLWDVDRPPIKKQKETKMRDEVALSRPRRKRMAAASYEEASDSEQEFDHSLTDPLKGDPEAEFDPTPPSKRRKMMHAPNAKVLSSDKIAKAPPAPNARSLIVRLKIGQENSMKLKKKIREQRAKHSGSDVLPRANASTQPDAPASKTATTSPSGSGSMGAARVQSGIRKRVISSNETHLDGLPSGEESNVEDIQASPTPKASRKKCRKRVKQSERNSSAPPPSHIFSDRLPSPPPKGRKSDDMEPSSPQFSPTDSLVGLQWCRSVYPQTPTDFGYHPVDNNTHSSVFNDEMYYPATIPGTLSTYDTMGAEMFNTNTGNASAFANNHNIPQTYDPTISPAIADQHADSFPGSEAGHGAIDHYGATDLNSQPRSPFAENFEKELSELDNAFLTGNWTMNDPANMDFAEQVAMDFTNSNFEQEFFSDSFNNYLGYVNNDFDDMPAGNDAVESTNATNNAQID